MRRHRTRRRAQCSGCPRMPIEQLRPCGRGALRTACVASATHCCGPSSAVTAAIWLMVAAHDVLCDSSSMIALIQHLRARAVADAPARHRIRFRHAVHDERAARELRHQRATSDTCFAAAVDEVLVDLVGHHPHMGMPHQHFARRLQFGGGVHRSRRVVRRIQDEPARTRRDRASPAPAGTSLNPALPSPGTMTGLPPCSATMSG